MAKKLTILEYGVRIAQKKRLAVHNAKLRQKERERKMKERDRAKNKARQEREYEKLQERERKENQKRRQELEKRNQLDQLNKEVLIFKKYLSEIVSFHKEFNALDIDSKFSSRLATRSYAKKSFSQTSVQKDLLSLETIDSYGYQYRDREFKPSIDYESWGKSPNKLEADGLLVFLFLLAFVAPLGLFVYFYKTYSLLTGSIVGVIALLVLLSIIGGIFEKKSRRKYEDLISEERNTFDEEEKSRKARFSSLLNEVKLQMYQEMTKLFNDQESKNNEIFDVNEKERLEILNNVKSGNNLDSYYQMLEAILPVDLETISPYEETSCRVSDYEVGYYVDDYGKIYLSISLPDFSIIPEIGIEMSPSGKKLIEHSISDKERRNLYSEFIISFAYKHVIEVIENIPAAKNILIECYYNGFSEVTGKDAKIFLLQVCIDKETFLKLDFQNISLVPSLKNFEHTLNIIGLKSKKDILSLLNDDKLIWATKEDEGYLLPFGLLEEENHLLLPNQFGDQPVNFEFFSNTLNDKLKELKKISNENKVLSIDI